jgi:hypothetical protein
MLATPVRIRGGWPHWLSSKFAMMARTVPEDLIKSFQNKCMLRSISE